ncbi:transposase [Paenibacillus sepulcri]|uniref:Transposase n=1 Tax=Paenibacillus sepulcri TaxID=359917 RepID=A0ABS7C2T1_9BACL|nr:transposase [Paenibacillus sepulcri]
MRGTLAEQEKATIYQYQLIRKIVVRKELIWSYLSVACIISIFQLALYQVDGAIALALGLIVTQLIQFIIIRLTLIRVDEPDNRRWGYRLILPWVGYIPIAHIELALFRRLQRHMFWLGLCAIGVAYPWANEAQMISLICWHLWTLAPRVVLLRQLRKVRRDGVLRIQAADVSYYHR